MTSDVRGREGVKQNLTISDEGEREVKPNLTSDTSMYVQNKISIPSRARRQKTNSIFEKA